MAKKPVDLSEFEPLVDEFLAAVLFDVSYATDMCKASQTIERKQKTYQKRRELKEARILAALPKDTPNASTDLTDGLNEDANGSTTLSDGNGHVR